MCSASGDPPPAILGSSEHGNSGMGGTTDKSLSLRTQLNLTLQDLAKVNYMTLGLTLFEFERFQEAVAEWQEAKRLEPNEPFARAALAVGLYSVGRVDDAKVQCSAAVALDTRYDDAERLHIAIRWKLKPLDVLRQLHKSLVK